MNDGEQWSERWIVDAAWLQARLGQPGVRVVDVRPPDQYALAHIPGAVNSDVYALKSPDSSPAGLEDYARRLQAELRRIGIGPGDRVVFYEDFAGASAARGVWMLDYAGIEGGLLLDDGLAGWIAAGGPVTREVPPPEPSDITIAPRPERIATADAIAAGLSAPQPAILLDTRNDVERAAGAIPGAVHLEWIELLRPDGSLLPVADARRRFAEAGIQPGETRPIVPYCGSGYRAAHAYVVLRALGFDDVRNYAASWGEWARRPDLPVERPAS